MILKGTTSNVTSATTLNRAQRIRVGCTNGGTITVAAAVTTFNAASDVDGDTITAASHPWTTGDEVTYSAGGGTAIAELTEGVNYYIYVRGAGLIKLAKTHVDAINTQNLITLTDGSSENHTLTATNTYEGSVLVIAGDVVYIDKKPMDTIAASASMAMTAIGNQP